MSELSALYRTLLSNTSTNEVQESVKEIVGILNLEQLEELRRTLDNHYNTIYNAK